MKRFVVTLFCVTSFCMGFSQIVEPLEIYKLHNVTPQNEIRGSVKIIEQFDYEIKRLNDSIYIADKIESSFCLVEFDELGRLIKNSYILLMFQNNFSYEYDKYGNIVNINNNDVPDLQLVYNEQNRHILKQINQIGHWDFIYDKKGNCVERIGYIGDSFVERWLKNYDEKGRLIEDFMVGEAPDTIPSYIWRKFHYNPNNQLSRIEYIDDKSRTFNGQYFEYEYNDVGDLIMSERDGFIDAFEYTYDKNMNWVERITFQNNVLHKITRRKIEYLSCSNVP